MGGGDDEIDYAMTLSHFRTKGERAREGYRATEAVGRFGIELNEWARLDSTLYFGDSDIDVPFAFDTRPGGPLPPERNEENTMPMSGIIHSTASEIRKKCARYRGHSLVVMRLPHRRRCAGR